MSPTSESARADVVVIGNAGIDTNVFLSSPLDLSAEGHFTENIDYVGQAGAYTGRGFGRLGHRTAFIGHVGGDPAGQWVRRELAGDGIDLRGVGIDPAGTARSVNLMGPDGSRINFYDGKGHENLAVDGDLAAQIMKGARLVLFHLPNWARHLLPIARRSGAVIACDLQDVHDPDDEYRRDFVEAADVLFVSSAHHRNPSHMLKHLVQRSGGSPVVCGRGGLGVAVASVDGIEVFPPPPLDLPIVDTNGAGDALAVGFLDAQVFGGRSVEEAVLSGQLAARWACAQRANSGALVTRARLDELTASVSPSGPPAADADRGGVRPPAGDGSRAAGSDRAR